MTGVTLHSIGDVGAIGRSVGGDNEGPVRRELRLQRDRPRRDLVGKCGFQRENLRRKKN